jgi:hypothetical protein
MDEMQVVSHMKSIVPEFESSNELYADDAIYSASAAYDLSPD